MRMFGLRALFLFGVGLSLSTIQAGDARPCDNPLASSTLAVDSGEETNIQATTAASQPVQFWFGE